MENDDQQFWNCQAPRFFKFLCHMRWEDLDDTGDPEIRFCIGCLKNVYLCTSGKKFEKLRRERQCVAIPSSLTKRKTRFYSLGLVDRQKEARERAKAFWAEVEKSAKESSGN